MICETFPDSLSFLKTSGVSWSQKSQLIYISAWQQLLSLSKYRLYISNGHVPHGLVDAAVVDGLTWPPECFRIDHRSRSILLENTDRDSPITITEVGNRLADLVRQAETRGLFFATRAAPDPKTGQIPRMEISGCMLDYFQDPPAPTIEVNSAPSFGLCEHKVYLTIYCRDPGTGAVASIWTRYQWVAPLVTLHYTTFAQDVLAGQSDAPTVAIEQFGESQRLDERYPAHHQAKVLGPYIISWLRGW